MPINIYKYQKVKQFKKRVCACIYENTVRAVSQIFDTSGATCVQIFTLMTEIKQKAAHLFSQRQFRNSPQCGNEFSSDFERESLNKNGLRK